MTVEKRWWMRTFLLALGLAAGGQEVSSAEPLTQSQCEERMKSAEAQWMEGEGTEDYSRISNELEQYVDRVLEVYSTSGIAQERAMRRGTAARRTLMRSITVTQSKSVWFGMRSGANVVWNHGCK